MKLKRILAGFMAAVVSAATLMAVSVTAGAAKYPGAKYAEESLYVSGYWNNYKNDLYYFVTIGNFGLPDWIDLYSGKNSELEVLHVIMDMGDATLRCSALPAPDDNDSENIFGIRMCDPDIATSEGTLDKSEAPYSLGYYNDSMTNIGFAVLISKDSPFLQTLASCDTVDLIIHGIGTVNGEPCSMKDGRLKVKTDFEGLDDYTSTDISTLKFGKLASKTYTGKAIKPSVTIKDGDKKLVKGTDYTLSYKNNKNPGQATVIVTGKGDYSGTQELTFNIVPKKVKVTSKKSGSQAVLSWKKSTGAAGYEVYSSVDGGKFKKLATIKNVKYTAKLTAGKSYKFKVRPYITVDGTKVYGSWSNTVTVN